jgi:hypothetical protein
VRASFLKRWRGPLLLFLLLSRLLQAGPFDAWKSFAERTGKAQVKEAVEYLEFRVPGLLHDRALWNLAAAAVKEGASPQKTRNQKLLDILRLDSIYRKDRISHAVRVLEGLDEPLQQQMKSLREKTNPFQDGVAKKDFVATLTGLIERGALFLDVEMKPLYDLFRGQALACWAIQKTLVGGLEIYYLDHPREADHPLTPAMMKKLLAAKVLQNPVSDPGYQEGSDAHYITAKNGKIFCTHHGFLDPPADVSAESTPRQQLEAIGEKDEAILDLCADLPLIPEVLRGGPDILR